MAKIGIDARMYGPAQTGIGTYIEYLVKYLAVLDTKNEYLLFMLPAAAAGFKPPAPNFKVVAVRAHWYSLAEQTSFLRALLKARCDLVHFPHFNLPLLYNRPFVVTIHDLTPKFFPGHKVGKSHWRRAAYDAVLKHAVQGARAVITPSEFTAADVLTHLKPAPAQVKVIYEGIKDKLTLGEQRAFQADFTAAKERAFDKLVKKYHHRQLTKPYIFYVGVWRNHKNITGLIRAFDILVKGHGLDLQLVLGGKEDPFYPEVRATWQALGLNKRVYAPGMVFGEELNLFYRAAQLFCLPSFYEGFGLVAVEAINQGTPVAAAKKGPVPEVIKDGGLYFNPGDPKSIAATLAKIIKSPKLQKSLVSRGQDLIAHYNWQDMAKETLAVYENALK